MGKSKKERMALIQDAAENNKASHLVVFLTEDTNLRSIKFGMNWEPLHFAAKAGALDSTETLLNWGADPNVADDNGCTPLHLSVSNGHIEAAKILIDHGAEPWLLDITNNTVLHHAIRATKNNTKLDKTLIQLLMTYKKYDIHTWERLIATKNSHDLTPLQYALDLNLPKHIIEYMSSVEPPKEEHVVTILLHGWNDNISDWKIIEKNFETELKQMVYLFAYDSLANRVSIPSLSSELRTFINEKCDFYIAQKNKVSFHQFASSGDNKLKVKVNILCYSTGGLIVRYFLNKWYQSEYRDIIERVVMVAPANFGSPFAKFGKSSVGRMYVGQKKVGSLFECGEELLTSLEPSSPFIWDLAHEDALCPIEQQHFLPNKIMATIIQGTQHYEKNLQSKVTRGDMKGTDGTVTISGASMRCIKYSMNLSGGTANEKAVIHRSSGQVAARLHPSHTHRSITTSLVEKSDIFSLVKRALESTREQFIRMEKSFTKQNSIVYSKCHTPGNLLLFQYEGNLKPSIVPVLLYHKQESIPEIGQAIDPKIMQTESRASIVGAIRSQFSHTEYHSRSRNMFYKIVDLAMVSNILISISSDLPGCAVSLAIALKGHAQQGRIIASTGWLNSGTKNDCFTTCELSTTHIFCISPLSSEAEFQNDDKIAVHSSSLQQLEDDEDIDDTLRLMQTFGITGLCRTLYEKRKLENFVEIICKKRAEDLTGATRASVICALAPFFDSCPVAQEGAAYLIFSTSWRMLDIIKTEIDSGNLNSGHTYSDLPSSVECTSLYQLTYKLLCPVALKFFQGIEDPTIQRYIGNTKAGRSIHLSKLVADHIYNTSIKAAKNSKIKTTKKIICAESALAARKNEYYAEQVVFPGSQEFLCKLCDNVDNGVIVLRNARSKLSLPLFFPAGEVEYEDETVNCIQEVVDDYQRLFPENDFCLLFPNLPVFKEVAKIAQRISSRLQIFLKSDDESSKFHSAEIFGSYVSASCLAFDRKLIDENGIVSVSRKSVEELQVILFKKQGFHPSIRWSCLAEDIKAAHMRLSALPPSALQKWQSGQMEELRNICKQNEAALWLSEAGSSMILAFRDWVVAQDAGERNASESANPLINICNNDSKQFNSFRRILVDDVANTNPTAAKKHLPAVPPRFSNRARSVPVKEREQQEAALRRGSPLRPPPPLRSPSGGLPSIRPPSGGPPPVGPPSRLSRRTKRGNPRPGAQPNPRSNTVGKPSPATRGLRGNPGLSRSQPIPRDIRSNPNQHRTVPK